MAIHRDLFFLKTPKMDLTRSRQEVAYFLTRFGWKRENLPSLPPKVLKVKSWRAAYDLFFPVLGGEKTEIGFRNSLNNYRDSFDHLFPENNREGWKEPLSRPAQEVFQDLEGLEHDEVWALVAMYLVGGEEASSDRFQENIWLISPGRQAKHWEYLSRRSEISIGWDLGDLRHFPSKEETRERYSEVYNDGKSHKNNVLACYEFAHVMRPGDVIIAKKGNREYIGIGIIQSDYFYESRKDIPHRNFRKVKWVLQGGWEEPDGVGDIVAKTLTEIKSKYPGYVERLGEMFECDFQRLSAEYRPKPTLDKTGPETHGRAGYSVDDLLDDCFLQESDVTSIFTGLAAKKNIILQGPPGTGKTYIAKRLAYALMEEEAKDRVEVVQFHQSYSYEDFIQGFRPKENGGFERRDGVFFRFCEKAGRDPGRDYFFLIDEINRGNLSKIFGELMMLIEADKRGESNHVQLTYSKEGEHFSIPANVHIIGTMNTADRSLAMVDYALRRRFAFFHMPPQFNDKFVAYLQEEHSISASMVKRIVSKLTTLNKTIEGDDNLGDGFEIGHSYFCTKVPEGSDEETWYAHIVDHEIGPQLLEYWFDDKANAEAQIKLLKA